MLKCLFIKIFCFVFLIFNMNEELFLWFKKNCIFCDYVNKRYK